MTTLARLDKKTRRATWKTLAGRAHYRPGKLAAMCRISIRQLERYFDEDFSLTPMEWLHRERMQFARVLMANADSIKDVAYGLGFKNPSHFCHEFKRWHGVTPTKYLQNGNHSP